jgi:hypothetical protein|tara:strand:- start:1917 stop:2771 length:855 start_codon:yes stop_codon:yes gene_type:complete
MANIQTLVSDIYGLFDKNSKKPTQKDMDIFCKNVSQSILTALTENSEGKPRKLRMSGLGKPARQLWYEYHKPKLKEHLPPYVKIKFLYGHILEELLLLFAKTAGHTVSDEQKELKLEEVVGHQDANIDGWVVDVKSASQYGFKKFKANNITKENDSFGYLSQIKAYGEAQSNDKLAFLAIDKTSGAIALATPNTEDLPNMKEKIKKLKKSLSDKNKIPPRCYEDIEDGMSGNRKLSVECSYCSFKVDCWDDSNDGKGLRKFIYSNGPRWFTEIKKEPNVSEDIP